MFQVGVWVEVRSGGFKGPEGEGNSGKGNLLVLIEVGE